MPYGVTHVARTKWQVVDFRDWPAVHIDDSPEMVDFVKEKDAVWSLQDLKGVDILSPTRWAERLTVTVWIGRATNAALCGFKSSLRPGCHGHAVRHHRASRKYLGWWRRGRARRTGWRSGRVPHACYIVHQSRRFGRGSRWGG